METLNQSSSDGDKPDQRKTAMALLQLQAVVEAHKASMEVLDKCFTKCVDIPGSTLTKNQQQCIWNCTQRLLDTEAFIAKRIKQISEQSSKSTF